MEIRQRFFNTIALQNGTVIDPDSYDGIHVKVFVMCQNNHEWFVTPRTILRGTWCKECKTRTLTDAFKPKFIEWIHENRGQIISSDILQSSTFDCKNDRIIIRCWCGYEWPVISWTMLSNKTWCPLCGKKTQGKTMEQRERAKQKFFDAVCQKGGIVVNPDAYINTTKKIEVKCKCGYKWSVVPYSVTSGHWCSICAEQNSALTCAKFVAKIEQRGGTIVSGVYTGNRSTFTVECVEKHQWQVKVSDVLNGHWCLICAGYSPAVAKERLEEIVRCRGGKILSEYTNIKTYIELECKRGHKWLVLPGSITNNYTWCQMCRMSVGERRIYNYLVKHGFTQTSVPVYQPYTFATNFSMKIGSHRHYWDVVVVMPWMTSDYIMLLFIEFDGFQHFDERSRFHTESQGFEKRRLRDIEKDNYTTQTCQNLLRIPYWERQNINSIMDTTLSTMAQPSYTRICPPRDYYTSGPYSPAQ